LTAGGPLGKRGPIPYDRHESILKKQREDSAAEHAAFLHKYTGLDTMSPEQWGAVRGILNSLASDPLSTVGRILDEMGQNPAMAPQVQAWIARRFPPPAAPGPAPHQAARSADDDPMPGPDGDGGYTPEGLAQLLAWQSRRTMAELQKANAPFHEEVNQLRASRQYHQAYAQATDYANKLLAEVGKYPGFKEHETAIKEKFLGLNLPKGAPASDVTAALYRCYLDVVMPTFQNRATQTVMSTLDQKAKANTTPPGGRATSATPQGKPLTLRAALASEFAKG
jgi:hypothetical protein